MDILVTFPDGTTELRAADSACLYSLFDPPPRHPSEERWYLYFPDAAHPFSFCARPVVTLVEVRGAADVYVWRIAGQDAVTKALTGEWQRAQIETVDQQIERLTRERDVARALAREVARLAERYDSDPDYWTGDLGDDVLDLPELDAWRNR